MDKSYLKEFDLAAVQNYELARKQWDAELPEKIEYADKPLKWWFNHWTEKYPTKPYAIIGDLALPYAYCNDVSRRLANALLGLGVKKGDRVSVMSPNVPQYLLAMHAIWKIGAIEIPANPLYTVPELTGQMNDSGAETVIVMAAFAPKAIAMMQNPDCAVKRVIAFQLPSGAVELPQMEGLYDMNTLVGTHPNTEPDVEVGMDDPVRFQYTGGTTGVPKGCVLTNKMVYTMGLRTALWTTKNYTMVAEEDVRTLAAVPFNHVYGFNANVGLNLCAGGSIVCVPQPKPDALLAEIVKNKPNIWASVPAMLIGLLSTPQVKAGEADITSLKGVFCGSAPCPVAVMEQFEALTGAKIVEGYGMSETSNILTINPVHVRKAGSVGVCIPDTDLVVVDAATGTKVMPLGETGELICRGPQVIKEYWQKPEDTAATIRDGWLYTADIVVMDEDGFIFIKDRKKDMIIVNGFNVFPRELDEAMFANPKVKEACAIGVPHPTKGEAPVLYIVLKDGETMDAAEAEKYLRTTLAPYKIPVAYEFIAELPRTAAGKADRKALQALYKEKNG
ncbi:MAG: AMP-binding protein [Oscillospiraceae bacterium]|nr:AMP-binding protein [Oscillospiraceae bacterium]